MGTIKPVTSVKLLTSQSTDSLSLSAAAGSRIAYGIGGFARFGYAELKPVFLQVEINGFYSKHKYDFTDRTGTIASSYERTRFRIDAPVMAGLMIDFKKVVGIRAMAGLVPSIPFAEQSDRSFDVQWAEVFSNANMAYTYGVGLDIANRVTLDVRVQNDFTPRRESTVPSNANYEFFRLTQDQIVVKLGFRLSKETE